jgi:Cu-Zn family superoxide dismutase
MKKQIFLGISLALVLGITACSNTGKHRDMADSTATAADTKNSAHANISATQADTTGTGTADFTKKEDGMVELKLTLDFPILANKNVAVHIHDHGDCGDNGNMTHGHWNPTKEDHGKWGGAHFHSGDIGNIKLDAKGKGEYTMKTDRWTIGGDSLTNVIGHGIIVHSGTDDYKSQPAGKAGSRIGCGVIM